MEDNKNNEDKDQFNEDKDEDYGLPKVSYEPVNREHTREPVIMNPKEKQSNTSPNTYKKDSSWPMVIGIIVIIALAGIFIYLFVIKTPEPVQPVVETPPPAVVEEEIPDATEFESAVDDSAWNTPAVEPAKPAVGEISDITSRTGRAYIVAGSFIDVDLARDYGNKLAGEGVSTKIIAPYGKVKYYRLSVADYPTVADALTNLDQLKGKYGENIWVLKY